jgi:hypothetical protein
MFIAQRSAELRETRSAKRGVHLLLLASVMVASTALSCDEKHARVGIGELSSHDRARSLTIDGAMILLEQGGRYDRVCRGGEPRSKGASGCVDHHFYVFPVVPKGWASPQAVPAWVTCSAREGAYEECAAWVRAYEGDITGAVAVRVGDGAKVMRAVSGWEKAIDDAIKRHALSATPGGPVLRLGRT